MKLQFLVPHYKETFSEIKPLLDSIAVQQNIDFFDIGVIIADDGPDAINFQSDSFKNYPFSIDVIKLETKGGVSKARNAALDHATSDYVMFCDADDMFFNALGLFLVFREMHTGFDVLISAFTEETRDASDRSQVVYVNHDLDFTFVHGKIYNRKFLKNNNLRWNDALTVHEDSYFNFLCQKVGTQVKHCPLPFYLWRWRDNSVCRHDPKYILKTYNDMIESNTALVNELKRRGKAEAACEMATQLTFDAYYMMNKKEWMDQENQTYRVATERRFAKYYNEFKVLVDLTGEDKRNQIIMGIKNRMYGEGMFLESITFADWIQHIMSL